MEKRHKVHKDQATGSAAPSSSQVAAPWTKASKLLPAILKPRNKPTATLYVTFNNFFSNYTSNLLG